jgi:hypothetical protein
MSGIVGQPAVNGESGSRLPDRSPPAFVAGETLPLADSNLGVYLALHTIFGRRSLPAPAAVGSKDPIFLAVQRDIENLLSYPPDKMASAGGLDQKRNQQVSRTTCTWAWLVRKVQAGPPETVAFSAAADRAGRVTVFLFMFCPYRAGQLAI